ncbi:MAG: glycosyltransferase family 4 protein [Peptococcaceae bacterium]|nr:glycosyltransferase family 4 protein [Peptococcaceae bacterium]
MKIHIISTINGFENEGMRNIATHLAECFEQENTVFYSSLHDICKILKHSLQADVTFIFARANTQVYYICRIIERLCRNIYIVIVQKPQRNFISKNNNRPLQCSYFAIASGDLSNLRIAEGYHASKMTIGINAEKFRPVSEETALKLKEKYGFDTTKPLIVHVGHCSEGRGLEDFCFLDPNTFERMVIASGMFESHEIVQALQKAGVKLHVGFMPDINEIYQMADVYLFPTRSAEFVISIPLSVMEALSCGTPVVAYKSFENIALIEINNPKAIKTISNCNELYTAVDEIKNLKNDTSYLSNPLSWSNVADIILQEIRERAI